MSLHCVLPAARRTASVRHEPSMQPGLVDCPTSCCRLRRFLPAACGVESKRSFSSRAGQRVVSDFVAFVARCLAFADQVPGWTAERKMPRVEGAWASTGIDESTSKALPVSALRWAYAMALSRAFTLERGGGGHKFLHRVPFLAPGADLLDHGPSAPVGWVFDDESRQFRIVAAETLAPGVQVRNDYGALASSTLAARFGFVLASNPFEALPLRISSHRRPAAAATSACLASMGLRGSQQLTASGISEEFLDAARVASLFAQGQTRGSLSVLAALNGVSLPGLPRAPDNANRAVQTSDIAALCAEISASSQGRVARSLKLPAHQEIEMLNDLRVAIATMAGGVEAELADLQWRGSSPTGATMGAAEIGAHADSRRGRVRPRRRVFEGRQSSLPPLARSSRQSRDQPGGCGALTKAVAVELGLLRAAQSQVVARLAQAGRALDGSAPRLASGREVQPPIFRESRHSGPGAIGPDQLAEVGADGTITSLSSGGEAFEGSRIHVALDLDDAMAEGAEDSVGYAQAQ